MVQSNFTAQNTRQNFLDFIGNNRKSRKLAHNTQVYNTGSGIVEITLHGHVIIQYAPLENGDEQVIVTSAGYETITTKQRINQFSPIGVYQKNWVWYPLPNMDKYNYTVKAIMASDSISWEIQ